MTDDQPTQIGNAGLAGESEGTPGSLAGHRWGPEQGPYERVRAAIIDGEFKPGDILLEAQVAAWAGVGRSPARDILTRLVQDELVERTNRGPAVRRRTPEEILDLYETRVVLEALAAKYAAERHNRIDRLRIERMSRAGASVSDEQFFMYTRDFHQVVWRAGHNDALLSMLDRLSAQITRNSDIGLSLPGRREEAQKEHEDIVDAVLRRDPEAAAEAATIHFQHACDLRLAHFDEETAR